MLRETSTEIADEVAPTWTQNDGRWREIDRALRKIARRRAALDADEARWLREAETLQIWRELGMVLALDYMERVLGYGPRAAQERLRVARALADLPVLDTALACGTLAFTAVRELTRVATRATERAWTDAAEGKNLREIEELVAGHRPGDLPSDPADPDVTTHVVRFELSPETFARLRQAHQALDEEHGARLTDDELVTALCDAALEGAPTGRAKFQVSMHVCARCNQGWQEGAGAKIAVGAAAVARAECDAQRIDGDGRARQDITPKTRRRVWKRDGGRCRVPGCRSTRGLDIHHIAHRANGGGNDESNLCLVCGACHRAHHDGRLRISGTADRLVVTRPRAHVGAAHGGLVHREFDVDVLEDAADG
jgi:hypothetical protein